MAYCVKCGAKVEDGVRSCTQCGAKIPNLTGSSYRNQDHYDQADGSRSGYGQQAEGQEYTYYEGSNSTQNQQYEYGPQNSYHPQPYVDAEECFDPDEVRKNKVMGVVSYLGILVLIPILAGNKKSQYVKFHANQGLVLFIVSAVVDLLDGDWVWGLHSWINFGGSMFSWIFDIFSFACFILMVMGIVSACKGEKKELPIIGKIRLLKY